MNLLDRHDWLRVTWILDQIEDDSVAEMIRLHHDQHIAMLAVMKDNADGLRQHWEAANENMKAFAKLCFPWVKEETGQTRRADYEALFEQWKQTFGDIKDPKVKAYYRRVAQRLRRKGQDALKNQFADSRRLAKRLAAVNKARKKGTLPGNKYPGQGKKPKK